MKMKTRMLAAMALAGLLGGTATGAQAADLTLCWAAWDPACCQKDGCADIIEEISGRFDARTINPDFPATFPRFVQHAIWRFCAAGHYNICNGNRIDDRRGCRSYFCPAGAECVRLPMRFREKH